MLSYQHIYHAGNLADVQKHALLCWMLDYMVRKDKPLSYFESHAGRGLYDLGSDEALKTGEAEKGVGAVLERWFERAHPFRRRLDEIKALHGATAYAGSPLLASGFMRASDTMTLCELHPKEVQALRRTMRGAGANIVNRDGVEVAQSFCPPTPRRGLMLIDPSYEVKSDYDAMSTALPQLHRKWNVGIIALWYPILKTGLQAPMIKKLRSSLPNAIAHEVSFPPVREGHKMNGSGMFIVNAPYGIGDEMKRLDKLYRSLNA